VSTIVFSTLFGTCQADVRHSEDQARIMKEAEWAKQAKELRSIQREEKIAELEALNSTTMSPVEFIEAMNTIYHLHLSPERHLTLLRDITVNGDLDCSTKHRSYGCTDKLEPYLPSLFPENLTVIGNLDLSNGVSLLFLPKNLTVVGNLSLFRCKNLPSLPENLDIGGELDLHGCSTLLSLPENLKVGGELNLRDCTSLTFLPNWITQLGYVSREDGRCCVRYVHLENTGLSEEVLNRLMQEPAEGMQFCFDLRNFGQGVATPSFESVEAAITFWEELLPEASGIEKVQLKIEEDHEKKSFMVYLARLQDTAEYKNQCRRPILAQRITSVMKKMEGDSDFTSFATMKMGESEISCEDGAINVLGQIELYMLIIGAEKESDGEKLREVGVSFCKFALLHDKIKKDIEPTLRFVDYTELTLAFEIRLQKRLNLPTKTENMLFRRYAFVTNEQIDQVGDEIEAKCTEEYIDEYLAMWGLWQRHLRRQEVAKMTYEGLDSVYRDLNGVTCIITGDITKNPVIVGEFKDVFDYDTLKKCYIDSNIHPITQVCFAWSDVRRVLKRQ